MLNPVWRHGAPGAGGGGKGGGRRGILRSRQLPPTVVQSDNEEECAHHGAAALGGGANYRIGHQSPGASTGPGRHGKGRAWALPQPQHHAAALPGSSVGLHSVMYDAPSGPVPSRNNNGESPRWDGHKTLGVVSAEHYQHAAVCGGLANDSSSLFGSAINSTESFEAPAAKLRAIVADDDELIRRVVGMLFQISAVRLAAGARCALRRTPVCASERVASRVVLRVLSLLFV